MMGKLPYEERLKLKINNKKFTLTNKIWGDHRFNSPKNVGSTMNLIKNLYEEKKGEEITINEWEVYYFINGVHYIDLCDIAKRFKTVCNECGVELNDMEAINYTIIRVIDESFEGFKKEVKTYEKLQELYKDNIIKYSVKYDNQYSIDIEMYNPNNELIGTYQVKPVSFYRGLKGNNFNCLDALNRNRKKHLKFKELKNIETLFVIVNGDEISFYTYDELVNETIKKVC